jgi:hypothetical protein
MRLLPDPPHDAVAMTVLFTSWHHTFHRLKLRGRMAPLPVSDIAHGRFFALRFGGSLVKSNEHVRDQIDHTDNFLGNADERKDDC